MAKNNANSSSKPPSASAKREKYYVAPEDFKFANISYEDATKELTKDNPSAAIALSIAEQAGLGKTAKNFFQEISSTLTRESLDFAISDAAFFVIEHGNKHAAKALPENKNAQLAIEITTNAAVVVAKSAIIAYQVYQQDKDEREKFRKEIIDFSDAYGETIRNSTFNPIGKPQNALLAKADERFELKAHERDGEIATSLALRTAQAVSRKLHSDNIATNVGKISEAEIEKATTDTAREKIIKEANAVLSKPRLQTVDLFLNNPLDDKGKIFSNERPYNDQKFNLTTGIMAAGAFASTQVERFIESNSESPSNLIAADLILYLNEQAKLDRIKDGNVNIDKLKKQFDLSKDTFGTSGTTIPLAQFIELIFHTHVHDQEGGKIPEKFSHKLQYASKEIADAILTQGNDFNENKLNPLALFELAGSGRIVAPDGLHVANSETVAEEIGNALEVMPITIKVDSYKYIEKLAKSLGVTPDEAVDNIKDKLRRMDSETRDFVALLIPKDVLVNEFDLPANAIDDSRHRAGEFALDNIKEVLNDLGQKTDKELIDDGLSKAQVKLVKENYQHVLENNDEELMASLRNREEHSLGFAILCAKSYMQELADGKKIIGYTTDNNIMDFEHKEIGNVIEPENAEIASASQGAKKSEQMVATS